MLLRSRIAGALVCCVLLTPALAAGGELVVEYEFAPPTVTQVRVGDAVYDRVTMPGLTNGGNPGEPALPACGASILVPMGAEVVGVQVVSGASASLGDGFLVEPVGVPYRLSDAAPTLPMPNAEIYGSAEAFPATRGETIGTFGFRGYQILTVKLQPVAYRPAAGTLTYHERLTVVVQTAETGRTPSLYRGYAADAREVLDRVDNPEVIDTYPIVRGDAERNFEMLILTTPTLASGFEPLRDYHNAHGTITEIHTTNDVGSTNPIDVRDYIRDRYLNDGIEYVIIGGDDDVIPARDLYVQAYSGGETETSMPGDVFFSCLDGTWNSDNDGYFGEPNDGPGGSDVDLVADVFVGRASAGNSTEVNRFVTKTLWYLNGGHAYPEKVQMVGEHLGFGGESEYANFMMDQLVDGSSADGYTTVGIPSDVYTVDTLYDYNGTWPASALITRINNGVHFLNHLGHGSPDYAMKLYNSDVMADLDNTDLCFVYSQTCLAGHLDGTDCWAETAHIKTDHGAFAVIMNARYGWGTYNSTDGPSQRFNREFWDAVFSDAENKPELGRANSDSKEDNIYRINESCMRWCFYELNLFGDPTLAISDMSGLRVTPGGGMVSEGPNGGPFAPSGITYEVENVGDYDVEYEVTVDVDWLTLTNAVGTLSPEQVVQVDVDINAAAADLPDGSYEGTVTFVNLTDGTGGGTRTITLNVGIPQVIYEWTFDNNPGWTTEGQWAFGQPTGNGGAYGGPDPSSGYTGNNVYGYNLNGDYTNNMPEYDLTTDAIDCSGLFNVQLMFRRWLGVEQPLYDHAYVRVSNDGLNWTTVWENTAEVADSSWTPVTIDISDVADNEPTVYIRWTMGVTDGGWTYCGWNIDDVQIEALGGEPPALTLLMGELPDMVEPGVATTIDVQIVDGEESYVPGSGQLYYRFDGGAYQSVPLTHVDANFHEAMLPPALCGTTPEFYLSVEGDGGSVVTAPADAPNTVYDAEVGTMVVLMDDDFQTDQGWSVYAGADTGDWERADPQATSSGDWNPVQPGDDHSPDGTLCYVTGAAAGSSAGTYDLDGGPSRLMTPVLDLAAYPEATVSYWRWYHISTEWNDELLVQVSNNNGGSWTTVESINDRATWTRASWRVADYVPVTSQVRVRFVVDDSPNDSLVEALVDDFVVQAFECVDVFVAGDLNCDGVVDFDDINPFVIALSGEAAYYAAYPDCNWYNADCNEDGAVDFDDINPFVNMIGSAAR